MSGVATAPARSARAVLGRTGLEACRIGIGGGSGLPLADLEYALDRGVDYVFVSSDFHALLYHPMWRLLQRHGRGSRRDELIIAGASYICDPEKLAGILADQLSAWGIDYVDIFQWGWVTARNDPAELLAAADAVFRKPQIVASVAERLGVAREVAAELRRRGYARHLAISTHDRALVPALLSNADCDVLMLRYNAGHRGIEEDVFTRLEPAPRRPGIVTFNTLHDARGPLMVPPSILPPGRYVPTATDLYRFALDRPEIDVVLAGPADRDQVDAALAALERPPLAPELRDYLAKYGDLHVGRRRPRADGAALPHANG